MTVSKQKLTKRTAINVGFFKKVDRRDIWWWRGRRRRGEAAEESKSGHNLLSRQQAQPAAQVLHGGLAGLVSPSLPVALCFLSLPCQLFSLSIFLYFFYIFYPTIWGEWNQIGFSLLVKEGILQRPDYRDVIQCFSAKKRKNNSNDLLRIYPFVTIQFSQLQCKFSLYKWTSKATHFNCLQWNSAQLRSQTSLFLSSTIDMTENLVTFPKRSNLDHSLKP